MGLRGSESEQTGNIGTDAVTLKFRRLGWHVAPNPAGEVGTDLLLQVRDDRRFDLGAIVGAQVKSGDSHFDEPKRGATREVEGWWFRDDDAEHLKSWIHHTSPHLVVLHDESDDTSYWVHVTAERVVSTGKGAKILVPKSSTVDADHIDELLRIGTSRRVGARWEGSAWGGGERILPPDQLRYALLTPRLIAPHPNRAPGEIQPHEAIALLVNMRLADLTAKPMDTRRPVPDLDQCHASDDWRWRLYAALYDVLLKGHRSDTVETLIDTASSPYQRAAAAAICCAMRMETLDPTGGMNIIDAVLALDDCDPVDHDWLRLHKARCLAELGDLDAARSLGYDVQRLRAIAADDPTAMAIAGGGADVVFTSVQWGADLSAVINGRDTIASWWRSQEIAWGLQDHFNDHFTAWANNGPLDGDTYGSTWRRLRAASLAAGMAADHSSWRHTSILLAKHVLTLAADTPAAVATALTALHQAGDAEAIQEAIEHVLRSGPANAVQVAVENLRLHQATRTSIRAALQMVASAADVLTSEAADRCALWILSVLKDPEDFRSRMKPAFTNVILVDTLTELVPVISPVMQREVIDHVMALQSDSITDTAHWSGVVRGLPPEAWSDDDRRTLSNRLSGATGDFADVFSGVVAAGDPEYREQLVAKICEGDLDALAAFGDVTDLDPTTAGKLATHLAERTRRLLAELRAGKSTGGPHDPAETLILINAWHPSASCWEPIIELLSVPNPFPIRLTRPLQLLRRQSDNLPGEVVDALVEPLHALMLNGTGSRAAAGDIRGEAASTLAVLRPSAITGAELLDLMHSEDLKRREAAIRLIAGRDDASTLDTLWAISRDHDPWVRAIVANQLAAQSTRYSDDDRFTDLLSRLLSGEGTLVARMVAATLKDQPRSTAGDQLADVLRDHLSAEVRRASAIYENNSHS